MATIEERKSKLFDFMMKLKNNDFNKYMELKPNLDYILYAEDKIQESHSSIVRNRLREDMLKSIEIIEGHF